MKPFLFLKNNLAKYYVKLYPPETFIGVTGIVGKTTCIVACKAVCARKYKTITTKTHTDNSSSFTDTLLNITPATRKVILEMGVNFKGEMEAYLSQVKPGIAIFTKSVYCPGDLVEEKGKLIESLNENGIAILNWDDPVSKKLAQNCKGNVLFYGTDPQNCTVWAGNIKIENFSTAFELNSGVERVKVNLKVLGLHHVFASLAAALLGVVLGVPLTKIKISLEEIEPEVHQMQVFAGPNGSILVDDSYSGSPLGTESAIDTIFQMPARRRIIVLGETGGLDQFYEELQRHIAQKIYKEKLDYVFFAQGDTGIIAEELKNLGFWGERMEMNLRNSDLVAKLLKTLGKGDICLIKGSRAMRLDEVVKRIAKKV